jgi:hypothetical protein
MGGVDDPARAWSHPEDDPPEGRENLGAKSRWTQMFPFRDVLREPGFRAVFEKLCESDPLHIRERCVERLRQKALLLPFDDLVWRAMAMTAFDADLLEDDPPLDEWLISRIDDAIDALSDEEREHERAALPPPQPLASHHALISEALGLDPLLARRACLVFNDLPELQRQSFWALVVERKSVAEYVAESSRSQEDVMRSLREAFTALSRLEEAQGEPEP